MNDKLDDKVAKKRTLKQNRSLHKWCTEVAVELNNRGIGQKVLLERVEVDHSMESIKSIWRAICRAKFGKTSTTELTTSEINNVYDEMTRMLSEYDVHVSFPSQENTEEYLNSFNGNE